jgi:hypothetical protein
MILVRSLSTNRTAKLEIYAGTKGINGFILCKQKHWNLTLRNNNLVHGV